MADEDAEPRSSKGELSKDELEIVRFVQDVNPAKKMSVEMVDMILEQARAIGEL